MSQTPLHTVPPPIMLPRARLGGNVFGVASMLAWAAAFPAAEALLQTWTPTGLIIARLVIVGVVLLPLWLLVDGMRSVRRAPWLTGLGIGALGFGIGAWLLLIAQALTDPVTVAIIASACPVAAVLCEVLWDNRKLSRAFALGLAATVIGGIIATGGGGVALGLGALSAVVSCFLFSWGSFQTVRRLTGMTALGQTALTMTGAAIAMTIIGVIGETIGYAIWPDHLINETELGLLAVYAVVGMALSQALWLAAVGKLGVALAAFHINIAPFYVMLIMLALGGGWDWRAVIGAAVVAFGVVIAQRD